MGREQKYHTIVQWSSCYAEESTDGQRGDGKDPLAGQRPGEGSQGNGAKDVKQKFSRRSRRIKRRNPHKPSTGTEASWGRMEHEGRVGAQSEVWKSARKI